MVVLGDIGHSPRMQYHALSFTKHNYSVDFIGYRGSKPHKDILHNGNIRLRRMTSPPKILSKLPKLLTYVIKTLWQIITLFLTLMLVQHPKFILLQNPPAIPSMLVALVVSKLRGSQLIIDWHNYGFTIMALSLGITHPIVKIAKLYERMLGKFAKYHICVSRAMKDDLDKNWGIQAVPMYDRPPEKFRRLPDRERHQLFVKLAEDIALFKTNDDKKTLFSEECDSGHVALRSDRPALLVSSTSWTEDEDFGILLGALEDYDECASSCTDLPDIVCVITGKGPLKSFYKELIAEKNFGCVTIVTPWLQAEDYPKLLGSADLGVCLHLSSSGLDLPMKVVDMFGCRLPVCAVKYETIHELVQHNVNGLVFDDVTELAQQLQDVLRGFPADQSVLDVYRDNLSVYDYLRWSDAWDINVLPLLS